MTENILGQKEFLIEKFTIVIYFRQTDCIISSDAHLFR